MEKANIVISNKWSIASSTRMIIILYLKDREASTTNSACNISDQTLTIEVPFSFYSFVLVVPCEKINTCLHFIVRSIVCNYHYVQRGSVVSTVTLSFTQKDFSDFIPTLSLDSYIFPLDVVEMSSVSIFSPVPLQFQTI